MVIVRVDWLDARTFSQMAHTKEEVIEIAQLIPAISVGFLVHEDKNRVVLASFAFWEGSGPDVFEAFRTFMVIPKCCIVKRKVLK